MKNRNALSFFLATLLSLTLLLAHIQPVRAIGWSGEEQLTIDPLQDSGPAIMQASNGTIWVVWSSNRMGYINYELFYKTSPDYGKNWSDDTRLTEDPFGSERDDISPAIMQSSNGTIWVVWSSDRTENYELFYKTSSNHGVSWSDENQLTTNASNDVRPSVMQASEGSIWVVWTSDRNGNDDIYCKTYNGVSWSSDTQLTTNPDPDNFPSIVEASNGTIWVVWSSYATEDFELFYKTFNGTVWSSDTQLTYDPAFDTAPSITQARDGTIWVVWQSGDIAELYYKTYSGSTWSSETQLTDNSASDIAPSIGQIDDKKVWVFWAANRDQDFDIYYKTSTEIFSHDVAIANVMPSATRGNQGEIISISVVAENQGDYTQSFDVSCHANATTIGTQAITLANGASEMLLFAWDTTEANIGNYTISAEASIVPGEIDTADNVHADCAVVVTPLGDVNGDFLVNTDDLILLAQAYGLIPSDPDWNPYADLNKDNIIDVFDGRLLGKEYG